MRRWGGLWLGLMVAAGLALGLGGGATRAAPKSSNSPAKLVLPRPDPPGHWRYMTQYPATTTSKCVGQVTNPMCAVDTYEACYVRGDLDLCRIALGDPKFWDSFGSAFTTDGWKKYRVLWAGRKPTGYLMPRQKAFYRYWHHYRNLKHPWPPGDVKIVIQRVYCINNACLKRPCWSLPTDFLLQPVGGGWKVRAVFEGAYPEGMTMTKCW